MPAKTKRPPQTKPTPPAAPEASASRLPVLLLWLVIPLSIAALMVWYLLRARAAAGEFGFPLDDSWIHLRFAQNLAAGKGFSFNPGVPTSTTTSVLWTLLLAGAYRVTHEYLFTTAVMNWVLCVLVCALVYHLSLTLHPSRWLALAAALVVAATAPLPWWALSGMEPPLYTALALLALLLHVKGRRLIGPRTMLPAAVMALAALARPELTLLFPLALADGLMAALWLEKEPGSLRRWLMRLAWQVPVFVLILAPQFFYNHHVTGYWLPTSFYSKVQPAYQQARASGDWFALLGGSLQELSAVLAMWAKNNVLLFASFLVGLWLIVREVKAREGTHRSLLLPLVLVVQPAAWALAGGYRPPDYQSQRYLANLDVLFLLGGVYGGWWVTARVYARWAPWVRAAGLAAALALSLAGQPQAATTFALNVKNTTETQVTIGRWLRDNTPKDALLAVNDVGAVGVIANRPVLDLQGLVTPEALGARAEAQRQLAAGQAPLALSEFIFARRPAYLVIFPQWYPEMDARRDLLTPVFYVQLQDNITCGAPVMMVYRTVWARQATP